MATELPPGRPRGRVPARRSYRRTVALGVTLTLLASALLVARSWPAVQHFARQGGSPLRASLERAWLTRHADALDAPSSDSTPVQFVIEPDEALASICTRLAAAGLVRDAEVFRRFVRSRGLDRQIRAGLVALRRNMTAEQVLEALLASETVTVRVTLLEGWRAEQTAERLAAAGIVDAAAFLQLVRRGIAAGPLVSDRPAGSGLEGYLFPDTYDFEPRLGAEGTLRRLLTTFETKAGRLLREAGDAEGLSSYELVVLASIVEREATVADERPRIARVFLNRLSEPPFLLNADPTVQYALGWQADSHRWWKTALTPEDLAIASPYNTYRVAGLPPTPIANPGLAAIRAVVRPEPGQWRYFVLDGDRCDGHHRFAVTWEEHLRNVERYRSSHCRQGAASSG